MEGGDLVLTSQWLSRLVKQLPGWHVWYTSGPPRGWCAVPAPAGIEHDAALALSDKIGPYATPQQLRAEARPRYGWDDVCATCNVPARECGHRQPESQ